DSHDEVIDTNGQVVEFFGVHPDLRLWYQDGLRVRVINPEVVVEATNRVRLVNHTTFWVRGYADIPRDNSHVIEIVVEPGERTHEVDIATLFAEQVVYPWKEASVTVDLRYLRSIKGEAAGTFNLTFFMEYYDLNAYLTAFEVFIDDQLVETLGTDEIWAAMNASRPPMFDVTASLHRGISEFRVVVSGYPMVNETHISTVLTEFENRTFSFMRVPEVHDAEQVKEFLRGEDVYLTLDPGTSVDLEGLTPLNESIKRCNLTISGNDGASLTFVNMSYPYNTTLKMVCLDRLDIRFITSQMPYIQFEPDETLYYWNEYSGLPVDDHHVNLTIEDSTATGVWATLWSLDVYVHDTHFFNGLSVHSVHSANISMDNSTADNYGGYMQGSIQSLSVIDCVFNSSYNGTFKIHREYFDTILFRNCSFNGMTLAFDQLRWARLDTNVSVVDCSFEGQGGYLTFLFSFDAQYDWEYSSADFSVPTGGFVNNTFSGEGSGVVLHHDLFESFLIGSSFS
ncbi:MAG: hypothetical protein KAQ96_08630, partial [Thermoplasmata archaeon]|nr:hypothetical protein [Thermoplasmata archaeon]